VRPARQALLVGLLGLAAAVAGCGDDGGSATPDTTTTPPTTASTSTSTSSSTSSTTTVPPGTSVADVAAGARPRLAEGPEALTRQLVDAETTIRDPAADPASVDAAGLLVQLAYRRLAGHPEWDEVVAATLEEQAPALVAPVTRVVRARRELRAMHVELSETLPAWRIVEPLPADELLALYEAAEAEFGVPWHVLAAINLVETGMGRIEGLSTAGAQGPMQFMPATWAAYGLGGDPTVAADAIRGAANYLAANGGAAGTRDALENAVWHYNHSDRYVAAVLAYSDVLRDEPVTYRGFHAWDVLYLTTAGTIRLEPGYETSEPVPVEDYLQAHPEALLE
jgi:membrane-bound lytic murein transglycosylase B